MEFHVNTFVTLIIILVLFTCAFAIGFQMVKYKSCGIFLFPLRDNFKGSHYYVIGMHSNQLFRAAPQCDITLVLLSATGKHQVIIKNEANIDESLLRLGTSLVLSSTSVCLGSVESMSLVIHGDPNRWKLNWIRVMDVQHKLTWDFKIPDGALKEDGYIMNSFKGKRSDIKNWLRFHNWILLFRPHYISSRVGFLTLIYLIFSNLLMSLAVTIVVSFVINTSHTLIWICLIGCAISVSIHLFLDILLHLSQGSIESSGRLLMCLKDEWQIAQSSANAVSKFQYKSSEPTVVGFKSKLTSEPSSEYEESVLTETVVNLQQDGIKVLRQVPVEDFSVFFESGDFDGLLWPKIIHLPPKETNVKDSSSGSGIDRPILFFKELERITRSSSMGILPRIQEESETSIAESPPAFAYSPLSPSNKKSRIDVLRPMTSSESDKLDDERPPKYGYVYTFVSKTSLITIREPIVELSAEDEAAFVRVNIPSSENDSSRPQVNSSSEMLFQDSKGMMWMPKIISNLEKKQHLIKFFRHWQMIGNYLQVMDLRLNSLHNWYTQHLLMTNETIAIERIRIEVLRLLIIFQVNKRYDSNNLSRKAQSVPVYCVRSAARFTATEKPMLDEHFSAMSDIMENFTIQVCMLVIYAMKDFVSVTRGTQIHLSGTVQYDFQSVVKHFIEEIRTLNEVKNRQVRHNSLIGDRRIASPHMSYMIPTTSFGSNSSGSGNSTERRVFVIKSTRSLQLYSKGMIDSTSYYSETDVPPGLEQPVAVNHIMSAEILSDVSRFVDGIVTEMKEILLKETAGICLYDFIICRLVNSDKNFRYCSHDFLLYLVTKLSQCIADNVVAVLGKELHLHVRNTLTANLIRIVQFVTEKLPDAEADVFKSWESEGGMHVFPIDSGKIGAIELLFRECVLRNCSPPSFISNIEELQSYKHDLWLLKLIDGFVQHQWFDRSTASIVHLVSKAMPSLNNKLVVGCRIVDETLGLVEMVEFDLNNSGNDRPIPFDHKDFASIIAAIYKRFNNILLEVHNCFHELHKIYLLTKLSPSEQEYIDRLANNGIIRNFQSETVETLNESGVVDFTAERIAEIRDEFLLLPTPILKAKWQVGIKILLLLNMVACCGITIIFSFLSPTSTSIILCMLIGVFLSDIFFVQTVKSFFIHKMLKWKEFRSRKKL